MEQTDIGQKYLKFMMLKGFFFVAVLGTFSHFFYEWSGENMAVGLFSPVNESVWEHMKLLFFPSVLYLLLSGKQRRDSRSETAALSFDILAGTFLIPTLFYTYTGILGKHTLFLDIAVFYLSVAAAFFAAYRLSKSKICLYTAPLSNLLLIFLAVIFVIFTFLPPGLPLFEAPV